MKTEIILQIPAQARDTPDGLRGRFEVPVRLAGLAVVVRLHVLQQRHDVGVAVAHAAQGGQFLAARGDGGDFALEHHGLQAVVVVQVACLLYTSDAADE